MYRALLLLSFISGSLTGFAQIYFQQNPDTTFNTEWITNDIGGKGVEIKSIKYEGNPLSIGRFSDSLNTIGFKDGILLSTGLAEQAVGPNGRPNAGANLADHFFIDPDLNSKVKTCDGVALTIDFIPLFDSVTLRYVFASEEYPEFVHADYNDIVTILLKPLDHIPPPFRIISLLSNGDTVSVKSINSQNNADLFIPNHDHLCLPFDELEYDGFTKPLLAQTKVYPGKLYRLKIALADAGDCEYDSGLFLDIQSLTTQPSQNTAMLNDSLTLTPHQREHANPERFLITYNNIASTQPDPFSLVELNQMIRDKKLTALDSITVIAFVPKSQKGWKNIKQMQQRADNLMSMLTNAQLTAPVTKKKVMKSARHFQVPKNRKGRAPSGFAEILLFSH